MFTMQKKQFMCIYDYLYKNSPGAHFIVLFDATTETDLHIEAKFSKVFDWYQCLYLQVEDFSNPDYRSSTITYHSDEFKTAKELRAWTEEKIAEIFNEKQEA